MIGAWRDSWAGRRWVFALAALALMVQVLVPPGFMLGGEASAPGLVICTGHGPLIALADHGKPAKPPKSAADTPCGFAAHGAAAGPPSAFSVAMAPFEAPAVLIARAFAMAPSRGLAAPPPPSQAPPAPTV